eukprot:TRINITY_DN516_c0_g1_i1.p4 TRINITY_DN516_c0_g1~~TRINITY_DN516_c0_g1_i1.p4  ORF type:complete len:301 (-),score=31.98 TRINITY_DN516_c0_g1_i1:558-1460(-)
MTNKMCERAQKRLRRSKCTANYDDSKESSRVSFMESPNESGFLKEEGMKTTPARKGTEIDSFSLAKKAFGENSKSILKKAGTIRPRNSKKTKRRVSTFLRIERLNAETNGKQEESITTRPKAEAVETFGNYIEKIERADHSTPRLGEDMEGKIVTRKKESVLNLSNWNKRIPIKRNQIMPLNQRMEENETERELIKYGKNGMKQERISSIWYLFIYSYSLIYTQHSVQENSLVNIIICKNYVIQAKDFVEQGREENPPNRAAVQEAGKGGKTAREQKKSQDFFHLPAQSTLCIGIYENIV